MLNLPNTFVGGIIGLLLFGTIVAAVQWPIFHSEIPNAWMCVLSSGVGWTAGFLASQLVLTPFWGEGAINPAVSTALIAGSTGLVAGAITGLALVWIVRRPEAA